MACTWISIYRVTIFSIGFNQVKIIPTCTKYLKITPAVYFGKLWYTTHIPVQCTRSAIAYFICVLPVWMVCLAIEYAFSLLLISFKHNLRKEFIKHHVSFRAIQFHCGVFYKASTHRYSTRVEVYTRNGSRLKCICMVQPTNTHLNHALC